MSSQSHVVTYTPPEGGGIAESRWIRIEQVDALDEALTLDEAAAIIDGLFGIDPCEEGMGGGGEAADEEDEPTREEIDEEAAAMARRLGACTADEYWETAVNVYRSHRSPGYVLRSETAEPKSTRRVRESRRQVVEVSGAVIELDMPYAGNLRGIPAGLKWEARGSTINLSRPISGRLTLRYDTEYDQVTLRIGAKKAKNDPVAQAAAEYAPGGIYDVSGGPRPGGGSSRPELPRGAVVAFWGDLAASCDLEPPEQDDSVSAEDIRAICDKAGQSSQDDEQGDCWKTVRHYSRCRCSYKIVNEWDERISAPCDGAQNGSHVGYEEKFSGFTPCEGDADEELQDPQYYRDHCCREPPKALPDCRKNYAIYRGGAPIDGGAAYWVKIYGPETRMVAVAPKKGFCGEHVKEWVVSSRNCCDGVIPMTPDPNNPERIDKPGVAYNIAVRDGKVQPRPAWRQWTANGGLFFVANGGTSLRTESNGVIVRLRENACPNPTITVDDGCFPLTMTFQGPDSDGPRLNQHDFLADWGRRVAVSASGGMPPYMWQVSGGLILEGWSGDGGSVYVLTPPAGTDWCVGKVTVIDQCGREDTATVRNAATGRWRQVLDYDRANPPGAPFPYSGSGFFTEPSGGYYAEVRHWGERSSNACNRQYGPAADIPVGNNILADPVIVGNPGGADTGKSWAQKCAEESEGKASLSGGCCGPWEYNEQFHWKTSIAFANYAHRLWEWVCQ